MKAKKIISSILSLVTVSSIFAVPTEAAAEDVQLITNGSFEEADSAGFPTGWDSNGKNLLMCGDFEAGANALKSVGKSPTGFALKWNRPNTNDANIAIVESTADEKTKHGNYYSELTFTNSKWNAVGYSNVGYKTDHYLLNAAYGGEYILRGDYKVNSADAFQEKKMQGYMFYAIASEDKDDSKRLKNETFFEPQVIDSTTQPSTNWQEMSVKIKLDEKPTDEKYTYYDIPHIERLQFRYIAGPKLDNGEAKLYFDNLKVEKTGRTTDEQAYAGEKSLKIVGYADTEDEVWTSDETEVVPGEKVRASVKVMAEALESYTVNSDTYQGKVKAVAVFDDSNEIEIGSVTGKTNGFINLSKEITVPANIEKMAVKIVFTGKGTVYVDDVRVFAKRSVPDVNLDLYKNKLLNPGFEDVDKYSFPKNWDSDGKNLVPNGNFESGSLNNGRNLKDTADVKYIKVGNANGIALVENMNEPEETGKYSIKAKWTDSKLWGGAEVKDYNGLIPLSYGSKYILRAMVKSGADGQFTGSGHKFQFNIITNDLNANGKNYDKVLSNNSWIPTTEWKEFSGEWTAVEKTAAKDASVPLEAVRYQIRVAGTAIENAELYMDNFSIEKLGRADSANANNGSKSLKIAAYDDGIDEVWVSDRIPVRENAEIAIGAALKTQDIAEGVKLAANFYSGNSYVDSFTLAEYQTSPEWSELAKITTVPEGADNAEIAIIVPDGNGYVWIDDVFLGEKAEGVSVKAVECDKENISACAGETVAVSVKIENGTDEDVSALVASVLYDRNYNIIGLDIKNATLVSGRETVVGGNIKIPEDAELDDYKLETVVWDNKDNVLPLCDRFVITE